jgi:hypothetical protein
MTDAQLNRQNGPLSLVPALEPSPQVSFCSHCGSPPGPDARSRVCATCEMGLLLTAAEDVAPSPGSPFIVIDGSMSVCAVSSAAEQLLATSETDAVNRLVTELIVPADAEAAAPENLAVAVTWAARGDQRVQQVTVRPANTFGVRIRARIASCGPRRAALLVFD